MREGETLEEAMARRARKRHEGRGEKRTRNRERKAKEAWAKKQQAKQNDGGGNAGLRVALSKGGRFGAQKERKKAKKREISRKTSHIMGYCISLGFELTCRHAVHTVPLSFTHQPTR